MSRSGHFKTFLTNIEFLMSSSPLVYLSVGPASGVTASLAFTFSGTSTERTWEIKVSQIECGTKQM